MKIAIQVMTPPYSYQDMDSAIKIAEAALNKGHEVAIFLFADAVNAANSRVKPIRVDRNIPKKLEELIKEKGLRVDICGLCMEYRGLAAEALIEGARPSGLPELAKLIAESDRFLSFSA